MRVLRGSFGCLHEYETAEAPGLDAGSQGAAATPPEPVGAIPTGEAVPPADANGGAAAAITPEMVDALRNDPGFTEWLAGEAAAIADNRVAQIQPFQGVPGTQAPQLDPNEFLDPMGENFGQNLITLLGQVVQGINGNVDQRFAPLDQQAEATRQAGYDDMMKTAITDTATGLGGLKGGDAAVGRVMAAVRSQYMPEASRLYGNTDRAAQVAIDKAIRAEQAYQNEISGATGAQNAEHLALINGARTEPGGVGLAGIATRTDAPRSSAERVADFAARARAINGS